MLPGATRPVIEPYGNAAFFEIWEAPISRIDDLATLLSKIERRLTSFLVRGKPIEGIDRQNAKRRLLARKAKDGSIEPATIEGAARHWIPLDLDSIACPVWLDPVHAPKRAIEHVVGLLPKEFHCATCWWAFTSGQGVKDGIRIRLFFWSDRPLADWELKTWLSDCPVDRSIFAPTQPIYVARPIFVGMPDPVPIRSGIWRGDCDAITPPAIERHRLLVASAQAAPLAVVGSGYEFHCARIGDHPDGNGFFAPVKSAVAAAVALEGAAVDTAWLRADLERVIRAAPRDLGKHDDAYIEFRVADLDPLIAAIVERQVEKGAVAGDRCEPTYPAPLGSVAEARAALAAAAKRRQRRRWRPAE